MTNLSVNVYEPSTFQSQLSVIRNEIERGI